MCTDDEPTARALMGLTSGVTRRGLMRGGVAAGIGMLVARPGVARAGAASSGFTGRDPVLSAMHVHGSYSEGAASWEQQFTNAAAAGVSAVWMTDHDHRARARDYLRTLSGVFVATSTGSSSQAAGVALPNGSAHLLAESSGVLPFVQSLTIQDKPNAWNRLRTGIAGHSLTHTFGASRVDPGALYEIVVTLSVHPETAWGPAGQYSLRYRYGTSLTAGRSTEQGGLTGVVTAPLPAAGAAVVLHPEQDIAAIWPGMLAIDNGFYSLAFVATSPARGVVADVRIASVGVARTQNDAASVLANMNRIVNGYAGRFPVQAFVSEEVSLGDPAYPHCNVFGAPPRFDLKTWLTTSAFEDYYRQRIRDVQAAGGIVSWNHVFGAGSGAVLSPTQQDAFRRSTFRTHLADGLLGADILEVGYAFRGTMPIEQFLGLWDTYSRHARFLTGNGVNDDHMGGPWSSLGNGFATGIWSDGAAEADLVAALRAGRAFAAHGGRWPGASLDTLTDDAVPMGGVVLGNPGTRSVAVSAANLPAGSTVELVVGPVDSAGEDPGTSIVGSFAASSLARRRSGTTSIVVNTSPGSCFVRPQVRLRGALIATGNPTWFLQTEPPAGVPAARGHA